jgi:hypothetical protein
MELNRAARIKNGRRIWLTHFSRFKGVIMIIKSKALILASLCCTALGSSLGVAQTVPDHPRVNEVNQRLDNQQTRINQGLANGTMTGKQAARDEAHDANIAKRESVDEAKHNGHLTKGEQRRLNRSENKNSRRIYAQKH